MSSYELVIIGAGPGGYVAAIRAAQLGIKTALVEKHSRLGGTCLNVGCIPSKALLESSHRYWSCMQNSSMEEHGIRLSGVELDLEKLMKRKQSVVDELTAGIAVLMKKNKVDVFIGRAHVQSAGRIAVSDCSDADEIEAKNIILATGARTVELPFLPFDGERVICSTEALAFSKVPRHLLIVGGGAIGLELGQVWSRLGAKVTVVEMLKHVAPFADRLPARLLTKALEAQGMDIRTSCRVTKAERSGDEMSVTIEDAKGEKELIHCDKLLVSVGRKPNTSGLGLEQVGVELDERGFVKVDEQLRTSASGIWAIGDLVPGPMLAHKAEEEGVAVVERIAGRGAHVDYGTVPSVVYTHPEFAMVGLTETQCKEKAIKTKAGRFYFKANGRAVAADDTDGLVQVLCDAAKGKILGVQIVGPGASEIIAEAVLALRHKMSAEDLGRTVCAHPTFSEALKEAALAAGPGAIHS